MTAEQVAPTKLNRTPLGRNRNRQRVDCQSNPQVTANAETRLIVKVNCAALPAPLVENELFGREKGAYTGALTREIAAV